MKTQFYIFFWAKIRFYVSFGISLSLSLPPQKKVPSGGGGRASAKSDLICHYLAQFARFDFTYDPILHIFSH